MSDWNMIGNTAQLIDQVTDTASEEVQKQILEVGHSDANSLEQWHTTKLLYKDYKNKISAVDSPDTVYMQCKH